MYIDTSLLVPYYCPEALSGVAERALRGAPRPAVSDLVEVEFFSELARKVRAREMSAPDARRAGDRFLVHLRAGFYARISPERRHYEAAGAWLARFTLSLRALDDRGLDPRSVGGLTHGPNRARWARSRAATALARGPAWSLDFACQPSPRWLA